MGKINKGLFFVEYYINCTNKCNLRCSFCCSRKTVFENNREELSEDEIKDILSYIRRDIDKRQEKTNRIVFYGGEPFTVPHIIKKIIKDTSDLKVEYMLYTNGLLMDKIPLSILGSLNIILVSFDGDKKTQERYRGKGTFRKIIRNLRRLTPRIRNKMIGRITVEEETDIFTAVTNSLKYVPAVHWQIVNKLKFRNAKKFIANYNKQVSRLWDYWLEGFKKGEILKIIPFQAIVTSILNNNVKRRSFRCGAGYSMKLINMNGDLYDCPESIGYPERILGNIHKGNFGLYYRKHTSLWQECKKCSVSNICLGRCKKNLTVYSQSHLREYCKMNKFLISIISHGIKQVKDAMNKYKFTADKIYHGPFCTEEIP